MKVKNFFLILILVVIIFTTLTVIFYNNYIIEHVYEVDMFLRVGQSVGIAVDDDRINFGKIPPGSTGETSIFVTNNNTYPLKVILTKSGEIKDWVKIEDNNFRLNQDETKEIFLLATPPFGNSFGNYSGFLRVTFKKYLIS